jgi:hypothetical protein
VNTREECQLVTHAWQRFKRSKGVKLNGILECKFLSKNGHRTNAANSSFSSTSAGVALPYTTVTSVVSPGVLTSSSSAWYIGVIPDPPAIIVILEIVVVVWWWWWW